MNNRLDKFIELLTEALQPHGGCQCGCAMTVIGAVMEARAQLDQWDDDQVEIENRAFNDCHDNYGSGS